MRAAVAALVLLFAATPRGAIEQGNLLDMAFGASVVSRTAELTLDQSALRAIDGDPDSAWNSPPGDGKDQTLVFALPSRTLIEKLSIVTPKAARFRVTALQVDSSLDGVAFSPLATLNLGATDDVQTFSVQPREAVYLRVTTAGVAERFARIQSFQARGRQVEAVQQGPIEGCWSVNGFAAKFQSDRGRITGVINDQNPVFFEGGSDGLVYRFVWTSGPSFGFGAMTTAPDKKHMSGLRWYVEPIGFSAAESWFGDRGKCGETPRTQDVVHTFMQRAGRLPLYGLRFDDAGQLNEAESLATLDLLARDSAVKRYRLISREFRQPGAPQNLQRAQVRLESLRAVMQKRGIDPSRFDWLAVGSDKPARPVENEIMKTLYGVIELQSL